LSIATSVFCPPILDPFNTQLSMMAIELLPEPTAQDQYMLELLNRARLNPQAEADRLLSGTLDEGLPAGTISTTAKQPLAFNLSLFNAAQGHSKWMLKNTFTHAGLDGSRVWDRATIAGYTWSSIGENIAWSGTTGTPDWTTSVGQQHPNLFIDKDIAGRGHRTNMMNPNFREIGISSVVGEFTNNGIAYNSVMTTQDFGNDAGENAFLTGVAYTDKITKDKFYTVGESLGKITVNAVGNGQTFTTTSLASGGYSLRLAAGTYDVTFSGDFNNDGIVETSIAKTMTISTENIKQDLAIDTQPTEGNDVLFGTVNADIIDGKGGNDQISGLDDNDILSGGNGDDILSGGNGNDHLRGGNGDDILFGGNGNDYLIGGNGDNTLNGGAGRDILVSSGSGNNDNILNGDAGNDYLRGSAGNDVFSFGNPLLSLLSSIGIDTVANFNVATDRIQLHQSTFSNIAIPVNNSAAAATFSAVAVAASHTLAATDFSVVTTDAAAAIATGSIVYNSKNGHLFYNSDHAVSVLTTAGFGSNGGQFAQLATGLDLTSNNFLITGLVVANNDFVMTA
jgi:serralysin